MDKQYRKYKITNENKKQMEIIHLTYKLQRSKINYEFNDFLIKKYALTFRRESDFWSLFFLLDGIVDLSDPDTSLPNSIHALQTAEAIRKTNNYPDWMCLVGLIHDMGKILYMDGCDDDGTSKETQWSLVGDTFITGCQIPLDIVLPEFNEFNLDNRNNINIYKKETGLKNCSISFGHDEYMYRMLKANGHKMPEEAEYIIRYHSLYAWHSGQSYDYLQDATDKQMKNIVKDFNKFDLYTKNDDIPLKWDDTLKEFYSNLVKKYISNDMTIKY